MTAKHKATIDDVLHAVESMSKRLALMDEHFTLFLERQVSMADQMGQLREKVDQLIYLSNAAADQIGQGGGGGGGGELDPTEVQSLVEELDAAAERLRGVLQHHEQQPQEETQQQPRQQQPQQQPRQQQPQQTAAAQAAGKILGGRHRTGGGGGQGS